MGHGLTLSHGTQTHTDTQRLTPHGQELLQEGSTTYELEECGYNLCESMFCVVVCVSVLASVSFVRNDT